MHMGSRPIGCRALTTACFVTTVIAAGGCSEHWGVVPPSPVPAPPPVPGPASLVIENVSLSPRVVTTLGEHYFWVRFLLRETAGTSAYIKRVLVTSRDYTWDSGEEAYGEVCFVTTPPIFMPAGSTLDLFNSDAGLRAVGDLCAPSVRARVGEPLSLSLQVAFVDAGLLEGVAEVSVTVDVK